MTWIDEMKEAMKMMKNACAKNSSWDECENCPFDIHCTNMMDGAIKNSKDPIAPCDFKIE